MNTSADSTQETVFAQRLPLRVTVKLNVRSEPRRGSLRVSRVEPDEVLQAEAVVSGERFLNEDLWFRLAGGQRFVWAGGVDPLEVPAAPAAVTAGEPDVRRREDGSITPLSVNHIKRFFGEFQTAPAQTPGFVRITTPNWERQNIVSLDTPQLADLGFPQLRVHAKAQAHFAAVFAEIAQRRLTDRLLSCGGTFVPRHISRNPTKPLSSHSWGIAIDLNVDWNGYARQPALPGLIGSVHDLLPIFARHGFAWGGHFSTPDGMHFELARRDV